MQTKSNTSLMSVFLSPGGAFVRLASAAFFALGLYGIFSWYRTGTSYPVLWTLAFLAFFLLRSFTWPKWYRNISHRAGIEDHFDKVGVVAVWLSVIFIAPCLMLRIQFPMIFLLAIQLFFLVGNVALLSFHFRDKDPMIPNALSGDSRVF